MNDSKEFCHLNCELSNACRRPVDGRWYECLLKTILVGMSIFVDVVKWLTWQVIQKSMLRRILLMRLYRHHIYIYI